MGFLEVKGNSEEVGVGEVKGNSKEGCLSKRLIIYIEKADIL